MVITLYFQELVNQMRAISHREVAEILDVEARYRAEAGSEKMDELRRCLDDASQKLSGLCARFLEESYTSEADNMLSVPVAYVFDLSFNERRGINKADALLNAMQNFMLEYALSKFYSIVSQGELSNKHSLLALEAGRALDELMYSKQPPRV